MTIRNPIVLIPGGNPQFQELPAGDSIGGASQGPPGMTWQGAWSSSTSYVVDDAVSNGGSSYIAIAPSTNQAPPNATYWNLLASKGDQGIQGVKGDTGATGAAGTGLVHLQTITTASSQATVDFSTISGSYHALKVVWIARDTQTGTSGVGLRLKVNADGTAANYTSSFRILSLSNAASGAAQAATTAGVQVALIPQDGNTSGIIAGGEITIPHYAATTFHKRILSVCGGDDATNTDFVGVITARWASTSAITELTFSTNGTAFKDGSIFSLYGMN